MLTDVRRFAPAVTPAAAVGTVRFPPGLARQVCDDTRRIVVIGAGGWIGQCLLQMLLAAMGPESFGARVVCFGSAARRLTMPGGQTVEQRSLTSLAELPSQPSVVMHLAFLTKDRIAGLGEAAYVAGNRAIADTVFGALDSIGAQRLFLASSGAAAFADDPEAAADLRLYGRLKRVDEDRAAAWARRTSRGRVVIGRLYALSGPFINKPETYALADLVRAVLAGRPALVRAPGPVFRGYTAVRDVLSLAFAALLPADEPAVMRFDTGGEPLELGELADAVAQVLGGSARRGPLGDAVANRYLGDHGQWLAALARYGLDALPLKGQIEETANWLAAIAGPGGR